MARGGYHKIETNVGSGLQPWVQGVGFSAMRLCSKAASRSPSLLGGSWVVISRVIGSITTVITHIRGLLTPLITTLEPPSSYDDSTCSASARRGSECYGLCTAPQTQQTHVATPLWVSCCALPKC